MQDRNKDIFLERERGKTLEEIGKEYGISKNRVLQIHKRYKRMKEIGKDELYNAIIEVAKDTTLTMRVFRALKRKGINSVDELKEMSTDDIAKIRNCGKVSQDIIWKLIETD